MSIEKMHTMVWDLRSRISDKWATPTPQDCLRYAFTEAGEAMDAYLRETRRGDSRNSERSPKVEEELADCTMMLLSALGPEYNEWWEATLPPPERPGLDDICAHVGFLLELFSAHQVVFSIASIGLVVADLETELAERLTRIEAKHG